MRESIEGSNKVNGYDENIEALKNQRDNFSKKICNTNHFEGKRIDSPRLTMKQLTTKLFRGCVDNKCQWIESLELFKRAHQRITHRPSNQYIITKSTIIILNPNSIKILYIQVIVARHGFEDAPQVCLYFSAIGERHNSVGSNQQ